jgi:thioredoxin-like negative regulator of GroEL
MDGADRWRGLLEAATVALDLPGNSGGGTGFVLEPGTVVTCAHVVAGVDTVRGRIVATGHDMELSVSGERFHRTANGLDLALLRYDTAEVTPAPPGVLTSPGTALGDRLSVYGHPRGDFRAGQWAVLEYQGDSRISFDDPMPMPRGFGTPVGEGFSGSPVVNHRTGAVCGMLARSNKAGSTHMVPLSEILTRHPVPEAPVPWLNTLTDEQVRAGGYRHPGPLLRDYLAAARDGGDEHPYATLLTDSGDIPLSTVYVRQGASHAEDDTGEARNRRPADKDRPAAESVLATDRHVLFTGGAGAGKSSLLRRLTFTAASAWLTDPAKGPSYVPVRVAADQLVDRPFPEALADAVGRDLPGLRRSLPPRSFEAGPMPSVDWLICVDGLDEVLDPEDRAKVIRLIQRWSREPYLRFVVASRSLVTTEMNRLNELKRYTLLEFGDREIERVARSWFEALDLSDPAARAAQLALDLRRGRLSEVARNPLYLTMICVVAAVRDLPRNPAELYARFFDILREKGARRLGRSDPTAHGITPALLERVHDVLFPAAERRQNGDARPLLDQVLELLADRLPGGTPARDTVLRALTFTGLVTQRGGDLYFLHHTVQEYLAGHALADRLNPKDPQALRTVREAIAAEQPNMVLFMAARWHVQGMPLQEFLRTAVDGGGWRDLLLCATILSDELVTDEELTVRFTRAVIKLHGRSVTVGDLSVETVLDRLFSVLDEQGLAGVVGDPAVPHRPRVDALNHLARRGSDRTPVLAAELSDELDLPATLRIESAVLLAGAGEHAAAGRTLAVIARDPDHLPEPRLRAAVALHALDHRAGTAVLSAVLSTIDFPELQIDHLLHTFPVTVDSDTSTVLTDALASNPALGGASSHTCRYLKGRLLASVRPDLLEDLARDSSAPVQLRFRAARNLPRNDELRRKRVMEQVCADVLGDPESPEAIASAIDECGDLNVIERVARDERLPFYPRFEAIERLIQLDAHSVALDCVNRLLTHPDPVEVWQVPRLAEVLRDLGDPASCRQLLQETLNDPEPDIDGRLRCIAPLADLGASEATRTTLTRWAADTGTAAADRLSVVEALDDIAPAATADLLVSYAEDPTLPGAVRHDAATQLLGAGRRDTASALLRRIAEDPLTGMNDRIDTLTDLAEVDLRAASETLHRMLDEPGLTDEHLWRLLDLADALSPDMTLRRRLNALIDDEAVPTNSFLRINAEHCEQRTAIVPGIRRTLNRILDDPAAEPQTRSLAVVASLGLTPYSRWRELMADLSPDPICCLSLQVGLGSLSYWGIAPTTSAMLSFYQDAEGITVPVGACAGLDPRDIAARWGDLVAQRRPEALTGLQRLFLLLNDEADSDRVRSMYLAWAEDGEASLKDRIAAATTANGYPRQPWYVLAHDGRTPPELRVAICDRLPSSGAHNRIPLIRSLATDMSCPVSVRAEAAALLSEDLGEEGRRLLQELSGPHTHDPEAHLAAAVAWEKLDVGGEAVAACRRVLDDGQADARHRVAAAVKLVKRHAERGLAKQALRAVLNEQEAPAAIRIEAAEHLIAVREPAEAHLGLLRLALEPAPSAEERSRALDLLPADLRARVS